MALISATALMSASCSQTNDGSSKNRISLGNKEKVKVLEENSLYGTFKGTFPCADCGGMDLSITINRDGTYSLKYKYQDKDERLIEECGVYSIHDKTLVETITPSSGEKTYYKFVNGNLVLSDSLGSINKGELAELYVLKRSKN